MGGGRADSLSPAAPRATHSRWPVIKGDPVFEVPDIREITVLADERIRIPCFARDDEVISRTRTARFVAREYLIGHDLKVRHIPVTVGRVNTHADVGEGSTAIQCRAELLPGDHEIAGFERFLGTPCWISEDHSSVVPRTVPVTGENRLTELPATPSSGR